MHRALTLVAVAAAIAASSAAAAGPLPGTTTGKDRAAWRAILHWPTQCERDWQTGHPPTSGVQVWRLASGKRLVGVTCILGAYQGTQRLYLVDANRKVTPLAFHIYEDPGTGKPTAMRKVEILGVLDFAAATGKLELFDKARGIGDCGIYSVFHFNGTAFVPVVTRAKVACDGKSGGGPTRWPKLPLLTP
jgi:hypothetical protein